MSCRVQDLRVGVAVDAAFLHRPVGYRAVSTRQTQSVARDEKRFIEKWKATPILHSGTGTRGKAGILRRLVRRIRKSIRG